MSEETGLQVRVFPATEPHSDKAITAFVPIPHSLDDCSNDHPRGHHFPLRPALSQSLFHYHLLYRAGHKHSIWSERSDCGLLDMSANNVQMDTRYGRRLLWGSKVARHVHRRFKRSTRRGACGPTYADTMGTESSKGEEGGIDMHVRDRHLVRPSE